MPASSYWAFGSGGKLNQCLRSPFHWEKMIFRAGRSISIGVKWCTEENPYDEFPWLGGRSHPQLGLSCQRWLSRPSLALQHLPGAQNVPAARKSLSNSTCQAPTHHLYVDNHETPRDTYYLYKSIYASSWHYLILPGSAMPFFTRHSTGAAPRCYRHHHLLFSKPDINQ